MLGKKKKDSNGSRSSSLGPNLSFLDVVDEACRRGGRYTLTVESQGLSYTVLVDRGGPFNISGGDVTGSTALAMAAALRSGTYEVVEGWPVDQPLYQLGLDSTLKNLLLGKTRTEPPELPPTRGVDSIRNAAWAPDTVATATAAPPHATAGVKLPPTPTPVAPPAFAPSTPPAPRSAAATPPILAPIPPAVAPTPAAPAPVAKSEPESIGITMDTTDAARAGREMGFGDEIQLDAASPRELGASEKQSPLKHLLTQAVLWTVQIEEPGRYTLGQAWILLLRSLRSAFAVFIDPIEREVGQRWGQARDDWRKSGETVAKQKTRKRAKPVSPE